MADAPLVGEVELLPRQYSNEKTVVFDPKHKGNPRSLAEFLTFGFQFNLLCQVFDLKGFSHREKALMGDPN